MPSCYAVGAKRALLYAVLRAHFCRGQGFILLLQIKIGKQRMDEETGSSRGMMLESAHK